jgi:prepilin-type N-terminal cleavage/methylation domain-containing protein
MKNLKTSKSGFTIVELLVSTVAFSLILTGAMAGMVQLGRLYYKGVATARTQAVNRAIMTEISQSILFSKRTVSFPTGGPTGPEIDNGDDDVGYFCVGPTRFTYAIDRQLSFNPDTNPDLSKRSKEKRHVMWVDQPNAGCSDLATPPGPADLDEDDPCSDPTSDCSFGRELVSEKMRISNLSITNDYELYTISLALAYGEDNDGSSNRGGSLKTLDGRRVCEASGFVVQFCAISELSTSAYRRLQ